MNKSGKKVAQQRVIIALDEPWAVSRVWIQRLKGKVWGFKIGSILYAEKGPALIRDLKRKKLNVFLDLKFHDIPNTVSHAVKAAFQSRVSLLTVHAQGGSQMMKAAAEYQNSKQHLLAVTVLTSFSEEDLREVGVADSLPSQVFRLADLSIKNGAHGLVCSAHEVADLRRKYPKAVLVVPGVRLAATNDDQKRTASAAEAIQRGATYIVVGRAITGEKNWKDAWEKLSRSLAEIS